MAQQYYTITEDGIYGQRQYYAGDTIPMEWAVAWGLDGAALAEPDYFDAATKAALAAELADPASASRAQVEALIAAGAGGQLPWVETFPIGDGDTVASTVSANRACFMALTVGRPITVSKVRWYNGDVVAGNIDVGLFAYDGTTLTRVTSTGAVAASGASTTQEANLTAAYAWLPGVTLYGTYLQTDGTHKTAQIIKAMTEGSITDATVNRLAKAAAGTALAASYTNPATNTLAIWLKFLP